MCPSVGPSRDSMHVQLYLLKFICLLGCIALMQMDIEKRGAVEEGWITSIEEKNSDH